MENWQNDIYEWKRGNDKEDVEILTLLNNLIEGLFEIEGYGIACMCERMNISGVYGNILKEFITEEECTNLAYKLEVMRVLLFGGKIRYKALVEHLTKYVDRYGYIPREEGENET